MDFSEIKLISEIPAPEIRKHTVVNHWDPTMETTVQIIEVAVDVKQKRIAQLE